jgi:alkylation response protein AidB-like acyl-CoA dehydrogenase
VSSLTPARLKIQAEARAFADSEVLPVADELDRQEADIPRRLIEQLGERRYFGIMVPRAHDGLGLGVFEYCLIAEELSRAWMSVASVIARAQGMGINLLPPEERPAYLRRQVRGEFVGAFALSEAEAGSDVANVSCRAERVGDEWVVNGEKKWVGWAKAADFIVLFARTSPMDPQARWKGITALLIEKERDRFPPGITGTKIDKIGYFGITTWTLRFEDFRVPVREWGESDDEGTAFLRAVDTLNVARVHTAARAIGAARGAFEEALDYAQRRVQFGRPIGEFQAIRFKLADMATEIEAARQLMYSACERMDAGEALPMEASMAKLFASEMAERVTSEALQILGGEGYTRDHAVQRHWRDARLTKIFEGTSEIQKRIISDALLGKEGR